MDNCKITIGSGDPKMEYEESKSCQTVCPICIPIFRLPWIKAFNEVSSEPLLDISLDIDIGQISEDYCFGEASVGQTCSSRCSYPNERLARNEKRAYTWDDSFLPILPTPGTVVCVARFVRLLRCINRHLVCARRLGNIALVEDALYQLLRVMPWLVTAFARPENLSQDYLDTVQFDQAVNMLLSQSICALPELPRDTQFRSLLFHTCLELLRKRVEYQPKSEDYRWTQTHSLLVRLALHLGNPNLADHTIPWTEFLVSFLQDFNSFPVLLQSEWQKILSYLFTIDQRRASLSVFHNSGFSYLHILIQAIGQCLNRLSPQTFISLSYLFNSCLPKPNAQFVAYLHSAIHIFWPIMIQQYESEASQPNTKYLTPILMSLLRALPLDDVHAALATPLSILMERAIKNSINLSPFIIISRLIDGVRCDRSITACSVAECIFRVVIVPLCTQDVWTQWDTQNLDWFQALINLWCDCVSLIRFEASGITPKQSVSPLVGSSLSDWKSHPIYKAMVQLPQLHHFVTRRLLGILCESSSLTVPPNSPKAEFYRVVLGCFLNLLMDFLERICPSDNTVHSIEKSSHPSGPVPISTYESEAWALLSVLVMYTRRGWITVFCEDYLHAELCKPRPHLNSSHNLMNMALSQAHKTLRSCALCFDRNETRIRCLRFLLIILSESENSAKWRDLSTLLVVLCGNDSSGRCAGCCRMCHVLPFLSTPFTFDYVQCTLTDLHSAVLSVEAEPAKCIGRSPLISSGLILELLLTCLQLHPTSVTSPQDEATCSESESRKWLMCLDLLVDRLVASWDSAAPAISEESGNTYANYTRKRLILVDCILNILPSSNPDITRSLLRLLPLVISNGSRHTDPVSRQSSPWPSIQLSAGMLKKIISLIVGELRQLGACSPNECEYTVSRNLVCLLIDWVCSTPCVLTPSVYTVWPVSWSMASVQYENPRCHVKAHLIPQKTSGHSDPIQKALIQPGLLISTWVRPPPVSTHQMHSGPSDSHSVTSGKPDSFDSFVHWFTFEGSGQPPWYSTPDLTAGSITKSIWSFQIYFSSLLGGLYVRANHYLNAETPKSPGSVAYSEGAGCLDFDPRCFSSVRWRHVLLRVSWSGSNTIEVTIIWDACWKSRTTITLSDASPSSNLIVDRFFGNPSGLWLVLGHWFLTESPVNWADRTYALGSVFFFRDDHRENLDQLALCLLLIGPDWPGYLDALECGAKYRDSATCILHALVRHLSRLENDNYWPVDILADLVLRGIGLIQSPMWLHTIRRFAQDSLWAVYPGREPDLMFYRYNQSPSDCDPWVQSSESHIHGHGQSGSGVSYPDWLFSPRSRLALIIVHNDPSVSGPANIQRETTQNDRDLKKQIPVFVEKVNVDQVFEPCGGIDVACYLLGEIVCLTGKSKPSQYLVRLQSHVLELLFGLTRHSTTFSYQFHVPALSDPGVEIGVRSKRGLKRLPREPWLMPLSRGHCLLARLIKHPGFAANSYQIQKVLFNQLMCPIWDRISTNEHAVYFLLDAGLLRCLIAFGSRHLWLSASRLGSDKTFSPTFEKASSAIISCGLIPHVLSQLSLILKPVPDHWPGLSTLTIVLLDRWQILAAALTSFREHFTEIKNVPAPQGFVSETTRAFSMPDQLWPFSSLSRLCLYRLMRVSCTTNADPSVLRQTRMLFNRLVRAIISLDADLYLHATERVFSIETDEDKLKHLSANSVPDFPHPLWLWWHHLTTEALKPQSWQSWTMNSLVSYANVPSNVTGLNTPPKMCEKSAKVSSDPEPPSDDRASQSSVHNATNRVHCDEDIVPSVVDWSHLAVGEITATELEVMARFEADVARRISGTADPGSSQLQLELDGDEAAGRQPRETEVISVTPSSLPLTDVTTDPSAAAFDSEPDSFYQSCCSVEYTDREHADRTTPAHADDIKEQPVVASIDTPALDDSVANGCPTKSAREEQHSNGTQQQDLALSVARCLDQAWSICSVPLTRLRLRVLSGGSHSPKSIPNRFHPTPPNVYSCQHLDDAGSDFFKSEHSTVVHFRVTSCLIDLLRPPLWLIHSMMAHPCVRMREAAISGYYVWIARILVVPPTSTPPAFRQRNSLNLISICHKLAAQLLQFAPCLHLSDPVSVAQFNWAHRHMCSSTLISRTFDLVSCVPSIEREGPISEDSTTNSDQTQTTNSLTEQLTRSPVAYTFTSGSELDLEPEPCINGASLDAEVDDVDDQSIKSNTVYFQCCWPILYASLLACVVDAVRSWWPFFNNVPVDVNKDRNSHDSVVPESTPETELCVTRLESLTTLIQESSSSYFAAALESGLLPFLYNVAWVLEASLVRYEDQLLQLECPSSGIRSLVPLVTTLSRLLARVTHALLNHRVPELNGTTTTNESPFAILTLFIRHLFVLSPTPIRKENLTRRDGEHKSPNPGPVAQCLVRRMLYTMVDTLTQQLDAAVSILAQTAAAANSRMKKSEMSIAVSRVESLFKQFRWTVDFTVDMLMYTETGFNPTLQVVRVFNPQASLQHPTGPCVSEITRGQQLVSSSDLSRFGPSRPRSKHVEATRTSGLSRSRSACRNMGLTGAVTWSKPTYESSPFCDFQQSLDQALITSLFTTGSHIQNGTLCCIPVGVRGITSSDCLTVICRALARLLVARTQPPVDAVAVDPFATYLLRLSNEDPWLLQACLNTLPRLFSSVFWSNLVDLENWLLSLMASEFGASTTNDLLIPRSTRIPSVLLACDSSFGHSVLTRSSSLTELSHWHTSNVILYQLEHLFVTVRSLLSYGLDRADSGKQTTAHSQTAIATPEVFRHRDLLILAQEKSKEHWWAALPASLVDRVPTTRNRSNFPLILDLLLPSFGASVESPVFRSFSSASQSPVLHTNVTYSLPVTTTNAARSTAKRGYSTKHLATLAHRLCVDGHNAWVTAAGERRRISGPLGIILWARLMDRLAHACSLFYDPASAPGILCVDPVEGPMRQRRRMFRTHLPLADRLMLPEKQTYLAHRRTRHPIAALIGLPDQVNHPPERRACNWSQLSLYLPLPSSPLIHLASASRHDVQGVWACSLVGLVHIRPVEGDLILGQSWLRFQPDSVNVKDAADSIWDVDPTDRLWLAWPLTAIDHMDERRYALRDLAVEIFPDKTSYNAPTLFAMRSTKDRDSFVKAFQQQVNSVLGAYRSSPPCLSNFTDQSYQQQKIRFQQPPQHRNTSNQRRCLRRLQIAQWNWLAGRLSNFAYLMELNNAAGRTYNDLMQYPIFPWVIRDYQSAVLDLGHPGSYRDLSKPIAVQIPERAEAVAAHYADAERAAQNLLDELSDPNERPRNRIRTESQSLSISPKFVGVVCPPYHYPSHCSNEAIVLGFLVRVPPYTFRHLRFQDNNFDVPDRLFHSVATTWNLTTTTVTCVKELIPEFYFTPELFTNSAGFALGRRQLGDPVDSVILPPWAKNNARLFSLVCRAALESDYITNTLPGWIDLMFGYKQTGRRAKEALNLYHPYTYFGAIDVDVIGDPIRAQAVEAMISNYGQTPKQLFRRRPHPNRFTHQAFVIDPPPSSPTSQDTVLQSHLNDWISTPLAGNDAFLQPGNANLIEDDCNALDDMVLVCHSRPTLSTYSEITPLETVIGLRWGTWAGSPHAPALRVQWIRTPAAGHATHLGYLSTGVWFDPDTEDQSVDPVAVNLTARTLEDLWDGCILHADCVESVSLDRVTRLRLPQIALNHHWQWTVLGCETNSRIWLEAGSNGPCLIKITCLGSPSDRRALSTTTFGVYMRTLNPHPGVTQSVDFPVSLTLTLPVTQPDVERTGLPFVTALTVSSMSRCGRQLFVGTRTGSIYIRQLPASLTEVTENGWIPKEFGERQSDGNQHFNQCDRHHSLDSIAPSDSHAWSFPDSTEAGLWELTAWRQLVGHTGSPIRALAACPPYGLLASGDARGGVCLWDMHRFVLISQYTTTTDANNLTKHKSDCSSTFVHVGCTDRRETSSSITGSDEDEDDSNILAPQVPPDTYPSVDGLCFNHITGELAAARWDRRTYRACWIGVYSPSGKQVTARVLDFYAEISDGSSHDLNDTKSNGATVPMAYSTVPEGRGVNCLLLGGPGGRLVWLNSWTLDTVHTMLLPQPHDTPSHVTALCFTPSLQPFSQTTHQLGEALCQGLFVADRSGYVYYLAPSASPNAAQNRTQWRNIPRKQTSNSPVIPDVNCLQKSICRGIWLSNIHSH